MTAGSLLSSAGLKLRRCSGLIPSTMFVVIIYFHLARHIDGVRRARLQVFGDGASTISNGTGDDQHLKHLNFHRSQSDHSIGVAQQRRQRNSLGFWTEHRAAAHSAFVRHSASRIVHSELDLISTIATSSAYAEAVTHQAPAANKTFLKSAMAPDGMLETNRSDAAAGTWAGIMDGITKLANTTGVAIIYQSARRTRDRMALPLFGLVFGIIILCVCVCAICECMLRRQDEQTSGLRRTMLEGRGLGSAQNVSFAKVPHFRDITRAGKKSRGAGEEEKYKFGDVSRGIRAKLRHHTWHG